MTTFCDILYRKYIISSDNNLHPEWIDSTSMNLLFYHEYRQEHDIQFLLYSIFMSIYANSANDFVKTKYTYLKRTLSNPFYNHEQKHKFLSFQDYS